MVSLLRCHRLVIDANVINPAGQQTTCITLNNNYKSGLYRRISLLRQINTSDYAVAVVVHLLAYRVNSGGRNDSRLPSVVDLACALNDTCGVGKGAGASDYLPSKLVFVVTVATFQIDDVVLTVQAFPEFKLAKLSEIVHESSEAAFPVRMSL